MLWKSIGGIFLTVFASMDLSPARSTKPLRPSGYCRIGALFLLCLLCLQGCTSRGREAFLVLSDIATGEGPSRLKEITPTPQRQQQSLEINQNRYMVDLYLPDEPVKAGLLLVPGAAEGGKNDPRLVSFAKSLARARFAVLVPDLPSLKNLKVNSGNIEEINDLFSWLSRRPELTPEGRAGIFAFSYAAGPGLLVALDPETGPKVNFFFAVGPYYSLDEVLTFFTTGYYEKEGELLHRQPNAYGKWIFVLSNIDRLNNPRDRELLRAMAERKKNDLEAPLDDLVAQLGAEGRRVYRFITNRDPAMVEELKKDLPPSILSDLERLDLASKDFSKLHADLIIVHGFDDDIIPYTQSVALAGAVPEDQVELYLVDGLAHVDLDPGLLSKFRLWRAVCNLLEARDSPATD
ncbi:MAG: hypothetical protein R6V08_03790 [Desulfuromonadales bacterium]